MLTGFLTSLYIFSLFVLILLILVQKGKGSMGLGQLGGGSQMLFGGSGGQDLFQKITWFLGFILIFGSIGISILTIRDLKSSRYLHHYQAPVAPQPSKTTK
ncbi:MAG: preprotein translocase subunit SecG [Candidatus Babeliales bacterium]